MGSAESQVPKLISREIIFEEFQRVWSQSTNVTDEQTDGLTDRQLITAIPRSATLRAVKMVKTETKLKMKTNSSLNYTWNLKKNNLKLKSHFLLG